MQPYDLNDETTFGLVLDYLLTCLHENRSGMNSSFCALLF